eukprot:6446713-Pyramimonas_sp.AAC.1
MAVDGGDFGRPVTAAGIRNTWRNLPSWVAEHRSRNLIEQHTCLAYVGDSTGLRHIRRPLVFLVRSGALGGSLVLPWGMRRRRGKIHRWRKVRMRKRCQADPGRGPGIHSEWISSSPPS